jgi:hypothetical protein
LDHLEPTEETADTVYGDQHTEDEDISREHET